MVPLISLLTTYPSIKLDKPLEYAVYSTILTL